MAIWTLNGIGFETVDKVCEALEKENPDCRIGWCGDYISAREKLPKGKRGALVKSWDIRLSDGRIVPSGRVSNRQWNGC